MPLLRRACGSSLLALITGCATNTLATGFIGDVDGEWVEAAKKLQVVHVRSELTQFSGFPVAPNSVLTCAHGPLNQRFIAGVEGWPMAVGDGHQNMRRVTLPEGTRDWVILYSTIIRFQPNRINREFRPDAGERVLLGGFPNIPVDGHEAEFWDLLPTYVEGRVVTHRSGSPAEQGLTWIVVPARKYGGISGGPAAVVSHGEPIVFGIVVAQDEPAILQLLGYQFLGIATLPPF